MKDKKAFIFYFLMSLILLDFGNQIKILSYNSYFEKFSNPIFSIVHINNTGGAFSLLQDKTFLLSFLAIGVLIVVAFYIFQSVRFKDRTLLLSLTLFSAGTLGNLVERMQFGYVIDYIKLNFIDFPVFNSFDVMITTGVVLYIIFIVIQSNISESKNEQRK